MLDRTRILKEIIELTKEIRSNFNYLRVTEYPNFYFVATNDFTDPMIFDKRGFYTGRNFVEIKKEDIINPKQVYFEGGPA